jgi:hypothetical protein
MTYLANEVAVFFVGDVIEMLDDNNHIEFNETTCPGLGNSTVDVYVSDDADAIHVYLEGYIERLHDGTFLLIIENQSYRDDQLGRLEQILFEWYNEPD